MLGEAQRGDQLVAQALALFLVGVDAVAAAGGHVLQAEQRAQGLVELAVAVLAEVGAFALRHRVDVAAGAAALGGGGDGAAVLAAGA